MADRHGSGVSLRIHDHGVSRDVLGPGQRAVVWVQGCSIGCPGCIVPETWSTESGRSVRTGELARQLCTPDVEGLTVSGGEPLDQPGPVADLMERTCGLERGIWLYTGYRLEDLLQEASPDRMRALALADVVVDGAYDRNTVASSGYVGSTNQRVLVLSDRESAHPVRGAPPPRFELTLSGSGELVMVGVPPPGFMRDLRKRLVEKGVRLSRAKSRPRR